MRQRCRQQKEQLPTKATTLFIHICAKKNKQTNFACQIQGLRPAYKKIVCTASTYMQTNHFAMTTKSLKYLLIYFSVHKMIINATK